VAGERVQRKLAAILAADVVGYSRLMEADEEGTLARLKAILADVIDPKIAEYSGRVFKKTGDGILAEFPSAVDAVRHAVDVQRTMSGINAELPENNQIAFRIGISLGDVMVDGDDLFGNGVNVAARMEGLAETGGICVSGNVQEHISSSLKVTLEDLGEQTVKNIDRPVRCYRVQLDPGATATGTPPPLPERPSIAVLPFENMSGDPEQEYFSDGITEDIITELSRFRSLFVIARNSSFAFRGQKADLSEIARKLGVQYLVEGSVRKAGSRVRVTAQLIEGTTGHHLWAERYDRDLEDIFAVQDELTQAVVSILPGRIEASDRQQAESKRTTNITAYDCFLLGNEHLRVHSPEQIAEARRWYQKATELDPKYARAHGLLAWTHICDAAQGSWDTACVSAAMESAEKALALDEDDSWILGIYGQGLIARRRDEESEIYQQRALALNPNDAEVVALYSPTLVYLGRWQEGLEWIDKARRLNPFPGQWYHWYRGFALFSARDYEKVVSAIKEMRPITNRAHAYLAASYGHMNQLKDAQAELALCCEGFQSQLENHANGIPSTLKDLIVGWADRYRDPNDRSHFLDGLRKAGWEG
jgi:adenylate cyclase